MTARLLVLLLLAAGCGVLLVVRARWLRGGVAPGASVPTGVVPAGQVSWLVLTTPWCASCGPVVDRLEAAGELPVVVIDVAEQPEVGQALDVRQAPTVLRVGEQGEVLERRAGTTVAQCTPAPF